MKHCALIVAVVLLCVVPAQAQAGVACRTLVRVIDQDTIVLDGDETVRLLGIDGPELKKTDAQRLAAEQFIRDQIEGKCVRLTYDHERKDLFKRTLAYVHLDEGKLLNTELIRHGHAELYTKFPFALLPEFQKVVDGQKIVKKILDDLRRKVAAAEKEQRTRKQLPCTVASIAVEIHRVGFVDKCSGTPCFYMYGTATIENKCKHPIGIRIEITGLDKDGVPVATHRLWPFSIQNAPIGKNTVSLDQYLDYDPDIQSFTLKPVQVKKWK